MYELGTELFSVVMRYLALHENKFLTNTSFIILHDILRLMDSNKYSCRSERSFSFFFFCLIDQHAQELSVTLLEANKGQRSSPD